jgi:hypothetical protein
LDDEAVTPAERLKNIEKIVNAIERNQFFGEHNLSIKTMMGAVRLASKVLLMSDDKMDSALKQVLGDIANAKKSPDNYEELDALRSFHELVPSVIP